MSTTEPIKNKKDLMKFKEYYEKIHPDSRNTLLMTIGLNTALRIGDILELRWKNVYDFEKKRCVSTSAFVSKRPENRIL